MKASDLKVGSIIEIPVNINSNKMNVPVQVKIKRCTDFYLWFGHNSLQRMGRNTFDIHVKYFGYKIISL